MLLVETDSPEDIAVFYESAQRVHGAMIHYRSAHSPTKRGRGRPSEEAKSRLVETDLPAIFARHFGFLETSLKRQEFAERRMVFMVGATKLIGFPMSRNAIRKRRALLIPFCPS